MAEAIAIGVVGINLEDSIGRELVESSFLASRISSARAAAVAAGIDLVINARTDTFLFGDGDIADTLDRARQYADAGADVLFVPGVVDPAVISELVAGSPLPLNVMAGPGAPTTKELADLGVARISVGPMISSGAYQLVTDAARELLAAGTYFEMRRS